MSERQSTTVNEKDLKAKIRLIQVAGSEYEFAVIATLDKITAVVGKVEEVHFSGGNMCVLHISKAIFTSRECKLIPRSDAILVFGTIQEVALHLQKCYETAIGAYLADRKSTRVLGR